MEDKLCVALIYAISYIALLGLCFHIHSHHLVGSISSNFINILSPPPYLAIRLHFYLSTWCRITKKFGFPTNKQIACASLYFADCVGMCGTFYIIMPSQLLTLNEELWLNIRTCLRTRLAASLHLQYANVFSRECSPSGGDKSCLTSKQNLSWLQEHLKNTVQAGRFNWNNNDKARIRITCVNPLISLRFCNSPQPSGHVTPLSILFVNEKVLKWSQCFIPS